MKQEEYADIFLELLYGKEAGQIIMIFLQAAITCNRIS